MVDIKPQHNANSLDDLVYRTMPHGMDGKMVGPDLSKAQQPASVPSAPPAPAPTHVSGLHEEMSMQSPIPTGLNPVGRPGSVPSAPQPSGPSGGVPNSGALLGDLPSMPHSSPHKRNWIIAGSIIAAVIIAAVILWAFFFNSKPASAPQQAATTQTTQTQQVQSQIPDSWRLQYFGSAACTNQDNCGDNADPDHDGLTNLEEYQHNTDPNNPDSDGDGLADGDEVHVFGYSPTSKDSSGKPQYPDDIEAKTKWNVQTGHAYTDAELKQIAANIQKYGLHSPTTATLDQATIEFYTNYGGTGSGSGQQSSNYTPAPGALDRDTQRSDAIKQVGYALLKYKSANGSYPNTSSFTDMVAAIKPLLTGVAVNTTDPTNTAPYVYGYQPVNSGADFKLSYYSETQNQQVVLGSADIQKMQAADQANQRDLQRQNDLQQLASALELYSNDNNGGNPNTKVYPPEDKWKIDLAPQYISVIPVDPLSKQDYTYTVSSDSSSYALQAVMENPPTGDKGYYCDPTGCKYY